MEDQEIIRLYFDRSETAIAETAEKYGVFCHCIAKNILASDADAEECVNDAYFAVWNRVPPETPRSLKAFLGKIVRNISLDRFDYNTAEKRCAGMNILLDEIAEILPDSEMTPFPENNLTEILNAFLEKEKPDLRQIFVRRYWFCDSVREISARFGMSESRVKTVLFRQRSRLRAYLTKEGFEL